MWLASVWLVSVWPVTEELAMMGALLSSWLTALLPPTMKDFCLFHAAPSEGLNGRG